MPTRPYVLISCAMSVDGRIDDTSPERLVLSGPADLARVDELRASCDAIVVGANTIRRDNPRLLVRDPGLRARRLAAGRPEQPVRVTLTGSGDLDPAARFFRPPAEPAFPGAPAGRPPLVYCASPAVPAARARLGTLAEIIDAGDPASVRFMFQNLTEGGCARVLVEGGATVLREVLVSGLANELQLAVAPFFVGQAAAPSFALPGPYPAGPADPMTLAEVRRVDGVVALRYLLGPGGPDTRFLRAAIELSRQCPPSDTAFAVGAIVVSAAGDIMATGFSREQESQDHAEEVVLRKLDPADPRLATATIYTSLVPCGDRASRPVTCVQHILAAGLGRVVFGWREPPIFTEGRGAEQLRAAGLTVVELPGLADDAAAINAHLTGPAPQPPR
ncbi:MAG TPA: dihydrofolate reductase family protein [Streptosporangiaceae bacterium]|nr:dihydrofolate reductase family protein [Streptosporangiaceae bacterium]